jgi:excisionase family DNA binding protein
MKSYSVIEAAARLSVSAALIYSLCSRRKIRHERHGLGRGTLRIPEDALEEYRQRVTIGVKKEAAPVPPPATKVRLKNLSLS